MSDRIHAGLWTSCKNCNPDWKPKRRERKEKRASTIVTADIAIRRQIAAELGDEEPRSDEKFQLLQKYGVAAARIDRLATKPSWMEETVWQGKKTQWFQLTKGLVPSTQQKRFVKTEYHQIHFKRTFHPQGTKVSPRNSGPTRTATRPS